MTYLSKMTFLMMSIFLLFSACKKDDPILEDENEFINQVKIEFTDSEGQNTYTWNDKGTIDTIQLKANQEYTVKIYFYSIDNDQTVFDITEEVREEDDAHQLFYSSTPINLLSVTYEDQDDNGIPVGLETSITAGNVSSDKDNDNLRIQLKHYASAKDGNVTSGSTDFDIKYPVVIQ